MKDYKLEYFCEYDKYPTQSYCAVHNVSTDKNLGDITKVDETKLPPITMICGGSPCQDFSVAGKQKGSVWTCKDCGHEYNPLTVHYSKRGECPHCGSNNLEKTRSSLLVEWLRIIRANKPKFGIYENVKNIVGKEFKETTFKLFEQELQEHGYNTYWKILNAKNYGIPQNRERVYLILIQKELDNGKFKYPVGFDNGLRLKDLLEETVDEKYYISNDRLKIILNNIDMNRVEDNGLIGSSQKHAAIYNDGYSTSLTSAMGMGGGQTPMIKEPKNKVVKVCQINSSQDGIVVDSDGISPTHTSGHGNCPKVLIKQATKQGYIECNVGGVADLSYPDSNTRRGRVQDNGDICPTITATETGVCKIETPYRIRKLTPLECWRLMGFSDENFYNAKNSGVSDSQLYKQAGNSIVTYVLFEILVELRKAMPYLFDDLKLGSFFSGIGAFEVALDMLYKYINGENIQQLNFYSTTSGKMAACGEPKVFNPLKGRTCYGWHFEQEVYETFGIARALKAGGGSGNIPKVILRE